MAFRSVHLIIVGAEKSSADVQMETSGLQHVPCVDFGFFFLSSRKKMTSEITRFDSGVERNKLTDFGSSPFEDQNKLWSLHVPTLRS